MKKLIALTLFLSLGYFVIAQETPPPPPEVREAKEIVSGEIVEFPEVEPEFRGGSAKMSKFIGKNIKYPQECIQNGISGKVYLSFVINEKGHIENITVERSVHPLLDQAAIDVIKKMPKWKPGKKDGKRVKCRARLPINFTLS